MHASDSIPIIFLVGFFLTSVIRQRSDHNATSLLQRVMRSTQILWKDSVAPRYHKKDHRIVCFISNKKLQKCLLPISAKGPRKLQGHSQNQAQKKLQKIATKNVLVLLLHLPQIWIFWCYYAKFLLSIGEDKLSIIVVDNFLIDTSVGWRGWPVKLHWTFFNSNL